MLRKGLDLEHVSQKPGSDLKLGKTAQKNLKPRNGTENYLNSKQNLGQIHRQQGKRLSPGNLRQKHKLPCN